jgi:hypothetical protein
MTKEKALLYAELAEAKLAYGLAADEAEAAETAANYALQRRADAGQKVGTILAKIEKLPQ